MDRTKETIRESGFYSSSKWIKVRNYVRQRDKNTCQMCGSFTASRYEVDHKQELNWSNVDDWDIAYNPDNCWLLCRDCHKKKTRKDKQGKGKSLW